MTQLRQEAKSRNFILSQQLDQQIKRIKQSNQKQLQKSQAPSLMQPFQILQQRLRNLQDKLVKLKEVDLSKQQPNQKYNNLNKQSSRPRKASKKFYDQKSSQYQSIDNKNSKGYTSNKKIKRKQQSPEQEAQNFKALTHINTRKDTNGNNDLKQYNSKSSNKQNLILSKAAQSLIDLRPRPKNNETLHLSSSKKNPKIAMSQQRILIELEEYSKVKRVSTKKKPHKILPTNIQQINNTTNHNTQINTPQKKQREVVSKSADGMHKRVNQKNLNKKTLQTLNNKLNNIQRLFNMSQNNNVNKNKAINQSKYSPSSKRKPTTSKKSKINTPSKRQGQFAIQDEQQSQFKLLPKNNSNAGLSQFRQKTKLKKKSSASNTHKQAFPSSSNKRSSKHLAIHDNNNSPTALTDQNPHKHTSNIRILNHKQSPTSANRLSRSKGSQPAGSYAALHHMNQFNQRMVPLKQKKFLQRQMRQFAGENLKLKKQVGRLHRFEQEYWKMKQIFGKYQRRKRRGGQL